MLITILKIYFCPSIPVDTGRKLNVHETFRRRPGRLLNVLCMFNLRPVSTGTVPETPHSIMNMLETYFCIQE